jgi:hypothetical protein
MLPVVVLTEPAWASVVIAGIDRAGGATRITDTDDPAIDGLAAAAAAGAEVIIVETEMPRVRDTLSDLIDVGARGLPVLLIETVSGTPRLRTGSQDWLLRDDLSDINVPVPAVDEDDARRALWDDLRAARVEERHHLVEVNGLPALQQLAAEGRARDADWSVLAAGAAGVLAGRMAVSNRRWRAQLDL